MNVQEFVDTLYKTDIIRIDGSFISSWVIDDEQEFVLMSYEEDGLLYETIIPTDGKFECEKIDDNVVSVKDTENRPVRLELFDLVPHSV